MTPEETLMSRIELLDRLFLKFKNGIVKLGGNDGVSYSTPMCEILINAVQELGTYERDKDIDGLINNALNQKP